MSKNHWIITAAVIILVAAIGSFIYVYNAHKNYSGDWKPMAGSQHPQDTGYTTNNDQQSSNGTQSNLVGANNSSDASINQDLSNVDTQMTNLSTDSADANSSLNQ